MSALGQKQTCAAHKPMPAILLRPNISQRVSNAMERALLKKWRFTAESGLNCRKYDVHYGPLPRHVGAARGSAQPLAFSTAEPLSAFSSSL
jgi:hypothetical protein